MPAIRARPDNFAAMGRSYRGCGLLSSLGQSLFHSLSALPDGDYLTDQPLQGGVALTLRQADYFQVEGAEVEGQVEQLQRQ